jgi:hypothetical protein
MFTLDPKAVQIIVGGAIISGFADGSFVRIGRRNNAYELVVGADGEGTRTKSNDRSGFFEIELMQTSESNSYLTSLAIADELNNAGAVPVLVKDAQGFSIHAAETAFIEKTPDADYAKTATTRVWRLVTENLQHINAGN